MKRSDDEGIDLVHLTSDANALTVLVDEGHADRVVESFPTSISPRAVTSPNGR